MVLPRNQNAGRNHNMKIDNSKFKKLEEFRYLGKTLTNKNSIPEEINSWPSEEREISILYASGLLYIILVYLTPEVTLLEQYW